MSEKVKHTPIPWKIDRSGVNDIKCCNRSVNTFEIHSDSSASWIAHVLIDSVEGKEKCEGNAALIVEAVNNHARLIAQVAALSAPLSDEEWFHTSFEYRNEIDELLARRREAAGVPADDRAALVKAVEVLRVALTEGLRLVSEESGWGTWMRMESSDLYGDADQFAINASAALAATAPEAGGE